MKRPTLRGASGSSKTEMSDQIEEAVIDKIQDANDRVIEIRPADKSSGRRRFPLMVLIGGAVALSYWLRKSQRPAETVQKAVSETADRTKRATEQAAGTIEERGESVSERVEEKSEQASDTVEQFGEETADATEEAGEKAADAAEEAANKMDGDGHGSTGMSSSQ